MENLIVGIIAVALCVYLLVAMLAVFVLIAVVMLLAPFFLSRIEDKNGMLVKNFAPVQKEIINPNTAFKMIKMMRGVVNFGTGARLRFRYGIQNDVAGKTGTTSNQADAVALMDASVSSGRDTGLAATQGGINLSGSAIVAVAGAAQPILACLVGRFASGSRPRGVRVGVEIDDHVSQRLAPPG